MPSTVLHAEDLAKATRHQIPCSHGTYIVVEETDDKQINECTIPEL